MQVQEMLDSTNQAVQLNRRLHAELRGAKHTAAAVSLDAPCAACGAPLRARPRCSVPHGALWMFLAWCVLVAGRLCRVQGRVWGRTFLVDCCSCMLIVSCAACSAPLCVRPQRIVLNGASVRSLSCWLSARRTGNLMLRCGAGVLGGFSASQARLCRLLRSHLWRARTCKSLVRKSKPCSYTAYETLISSPLSTAIKPMGHDPELCARAGGHIPMLQVFPSGAVYHTSCAAQRIMQLSPHREFCDKLRGLLKTLAAQDKSAGKAVGAEAVAKAQQQLAAILRQEGDPLNTEAVLQMLAQPYGSMTAHERQLWSLSAS